MGFQGSCPGCGSEVEFGVANSVVTICDSCETVVGRGDGKLEDYGKVADLVQTDSPLQVGLDGEAKGIPFEITGRTQIRHAAGGVWDEWYIAFRDGKKWGWLAEAQGKYYLTFPKRLPQDHSLPALHELSVEDEITIPGQGTMKVAEIGEATIISAEGEIPFAFRPGERVVYADLAGPGGKFATLDASDEQLALYVGGEFDLETLGISETAESREDGARTVDAVGVNCPNCGGSIEMKAPDESLRVTCPFCDSMLGVEEGNLKFLEVLQQPKATPVIPLGSDATLRGRKYTVIGFMQRKVRVEGADYRWHEYLLYTPRKPFHWLVHGTNRHWSLGKPVSAGDVRCGGRTANYKGQTFTLFDRGYPIVTAVYGEFYWGVEVGEKTAAADYIKPPLMISREKSMIETEPPIVVGQTDASGVPPVVAPVINSDAMATAAKAPPKPTAAEVNYTVSEYVPVKEIESAFGLKGIPQPSGVAANQPYPHSGIYLLALCMLLFAIVAGGLVFVTSRRDQVFTQTVKLQKTATKRQAIHTEPFKLRGGSNIRITSTTTKRNNWVHLDGQLHNEKNNQMTKYSMVMYGDQAGAGRKRQKFLSALPGGSYTMRVEFQWQNSPHTDQDVTITIHQGVPRLRYFVWLVMLLLLIPIGIAIHQGMFTASRWSESSTTG